MPVNPPFTDVDVGKFLKICTDSDATVILTDKLFARLYTLKLRKSQVTQFGKRVASVFGQQGGAEEAFGFSDLEQLQWITTSGRGTSFEGIEFEEQPLDEPAFIMYSSGSTASSRP